MSPHDDSPGKMKYSLNDLTQEELEALIEVYPGGQEPDDAFLAALMQEYARRIDTPSLDTEAEHAMSRLMDVLGNMDESKPKKAKRSHHPVRITLIAAALSVLLVEVVFADGGAFLRSVVQSITRSDWIQTVFGNGIESAEETLVSYPGKADYTLPARERVTIDTAKADAVVDDTVMDVNMAVTDGDWTYTVESIIMDENGMGAFTYTIENPNGLGELVVNEYDSELISHLPRVYPNGNEPMIPVAVRVYISDEGRTDTFVRAAAYMGIPSGLADIMDGDNTLTIDFDSGYDVTVANDDGTTSLDHVFSSLSIPLHLKHFAAPIELTADGGWTASVSPVGLRIDQNGAIGEDEYEAHGIILHFSDGSEYVVYSADPYVINYAYGFVVSDGYSRYGSSRYVFNRVIDPEDITSITYSGGYQNEQGQHTIDLTFVPTS